MILKFNNYIKEELNVEKMDKETSKILKKNFIYRITEYKTYILSNIYVDRGKKEVEYKNFNSVDLNVILRELNNEFSKELIKKVDVNKLISGVNKIMKTKDINVKRDIRKLFEDYFKKINDIF
jgi:hypothetical protein